MRNVHIDRVMRVVGTTLALSLTLGPTGARAHAIRFFVPNPAPGGAIAAGASRTNATALENDVTVPPPPSFPGCYEFVNGWAKIPCASDAYVRTHYPPTTYSLALQATAKTSGPHIGQIPEFVYGEVNMHFDSVGSITDSMYGPNAFSLQDNTNFFTGTNGHTNWVQFTDQSHPGQPDGLCIWNIDVTTSDYRPTCAPAPRVRPGGFIAGDKVRVQGFTTPAGLLKAIYTLPWLAVPIEAVVAVDMYGLAGRWTENSGWVLGMGLGSQLSFSSAEVWTRIGASNCQGDVARGSLQNGCPGEPLEFFPSAIVRDAGVTAEGNNLLPVTGAPPLHVPPLSWENEDLLWMEFVATTTGRCPAHTSGPVCTPN